MFDIICIVMCVTDSILQLYYIELIVLKRLTKTPENYFSWNLHDFKKITEIYLLVIGLYSYEQNKLNIGTHLLFVES